MVNYSYNKLIEKYGNDEQTKSYFNKLLISFAIFLMSLTLFIGLTLMLEFSFLKGFDKGVDDYIFSYRSPIITIIMTFISHSGDTIGYIVIILLTSIYLFLKNKWRLGVQSIVILILSTFVNYLLKGIIARPRPFKFSLIEANYYSYPSGHAMSAMVFYGFLIYLTYLLVDHFWLKYVVIFVFIIMNLAIGLSRVYLGVHYTSDIIGGYLSGLFWLMLCFFVINVLDFRKLVYFK